MARPASTSAPTLLAKLLTQLGFRLRVNHKNLARRCDPDRDAQFTYIAAQREAFTAQGWPVISIDTKHKELVGNFKNPGAVYARRPIEVNDHDFRSDAKGIAIPYGVYDVRANRGSLFVGTTHDTPQFAVDNLARWWIYDGRRRYPGATQLLVLADGGGSNGHRTRAWKYQLQQQLCDRYGLTITLCHYPTGASKWNPIEHRMFSEISKNWAGQPLDSYETILNYARTTRTTTGLQIKAYLIDKNYPKGVKISDHAMDQLQLHPHATQPARNYTLSPR